MMDKRDIKYDLTDFSADAEFEIALVQANIAFSANQPGSKAESSLQVKHFNARVCPAMVNLQFNLNEGSRKKSVDGLISLKYQLGRCRTELNFDKGRLDASMYVLKKDVDKAKDIIQSKMHGQMRELAKVIKDVTAGIKSLSNESDEPTP